MSEQNLTPDISADDDTEGHGRIRGAAADADDDTEGHYHWVKGAAGDSDDNTEGRGRVRGAAGDADDDTESPFFR